jgi:hypothetical protein
MPLSHFAMMDSVMTRHYPVRYGKSRPGAANLRVGALVRMADPALTAMKFTISRRILLVGGADRSAAQMWLPVWPTAPESGKH